MNGMTVLRMLAVLLLTGLCTCSLRRKAPRPVMAEITFDDLLIQGGNGSADDESTNLEARVSADLLINGWDSWVNDKRQRIDVFADRYREFLQPLLTEAELKRAVRKYAGEEGYETRGLFDVPGPADPQQSRRFLFTGRSDLSMALVRTGKKPLSEGIRIVAVDMDFPRMIIKHNPVFGQDGYALCQIAYGGYPRKHQWLSVPLGIRGEVTGTDGAVREVAIGGDDVSLVIPDLLPHLARAAQRHMLITVEDLDLVMDHQPLARQGDAGLADSLFVLLASRYGLDRDGIRAARLEVVPLYPVCEIGVDRGMLGSAGQSAVLPVFVALEALNTIDEPEYTTLVLLTSGKDGGEDFASYHPVLAPLVASLLAAEHTEKGVPQSAVRTVLARSRAVYMGVEAAVNPVFKDGWGDIGYGPVLVTAEEDPGYIHDILTLFRSEQILWQFLGKEFREGAMDLQMEQEGVTCLNLLCPLLARGAGLEIVSKMDLYLSYLAVRTFCEHPLN